MAEGTTICFFYQGHLQGMPSIHRKCLGIMSRGDVVEKLYLGHVEKTVLLSLSRSEKLPLTSVKADDNHVFILGMSF